MQFYLWATMSLLIVCSNTVCLTFFNQRKQVLANINTWMLITDKVVVVLIKTLNSFVVKIYRTKSFMKMAKIRSYLDVDNNISYTWFVIFSWIYLFQLLLCFQTYLTSYHFPWDILEKFEVFFFYIKVFHKKENNFYIYN